MTTLEARNCQTVFNLSDMGIIASRLSLMKLNSLWYSPSSCIINVCRPAGGISAVKCSTPIIHQLEVDIDCV